MTKIFFLTFITFIGLANLSGQNTQYHNIDSLYHIIDSLKKNDANIELIHKYVNLILKSDSCNADLFWYKGWLYDKMGDYEAAKYFYFRAIAVDSLHFNALYNLGALYYNEGIREGDTAFYEMTSKRFLEKFFIASNKFSLSQIFFSRAFSLNPDDPELIGILNEIRKRLFRTPKHIEKLINNQQE